MGLKSFTGTSELGFRRLFHQDRPGEKILLQSSLLVYTPRMTRGLVNPPAQKWASSMRKVQ